MTNTPPQTLTPRQREIFNSLLENFLQEGFEGFTIDNAARDYKCSKSTIYALGKSRDEIIRRVLVSYFREITRRTELASKPSPAANYTASLEAYFDAITSALSQASPKFMQDLAREKVGQEVYSLNTAGALRHINALLQGGIANGEFRAENTAFVSTLTQRAMDDIQQGVYSPLLEPARAYSALGQLILHGIHA